MTLTKPREDYGSIEHDPSQSSPSLDILVIDIAENTGVVATFDEQCHCIKCTNPNMTTLYRIAQEALTNAAKHAQASHIKVELHCSDNGRVELNVEDDGVGHRANRGIAGSNARSAGLGMNIMAHRSQLIGATLRVSTGSKGGTQLSCIAPCAEFQHSISNQET